MKKIFFLIAILFCSICINDSVSGSVISKTETIEYWNEVLKDRQNKISFLRSNFETISSLYEYKTSMLAKSNEFTEVKFQQLKFAMLTGVDSPYEFRLIAKEALSLITLFNEDLNLAVVAQRTLEDKLLVLNNSNTSLSSLEKQNIPSKIKQEISKTKKDISFLADKFIILKKSLDLIILKSEKLKNILEVEAYDFNQMVYHQLYFYLFSPRDSFFSSETWYLFDYHSSEWVNAANGSLLRKLPDSIGEWFYLLIFLLCSIPIFLFGNFLLKKYNKNQNKLLLNSWFWFVLAGVLLSYSHFIMYFPETVFTVKIAFICVIRGVMNISWGLKKRINIEELRPPLEPLFWLYTFGIMLQIFDLFRVLMICCWILGTAVAIYFMYRRIKYSYSSFEKTIITLSIIICSISIILAINGLMFLSLLCTMGWFLTALGIKFGINCSAAIKNLINIICDNKFLMTSIFLIGFGVPLIWCIIVLLVFLWLSNQIIDTSIFFNSLNSVTYIYGVGINLFYIAIAIYLFLVFKTIINVIKASLNKFSGSSKLDPTVVPSISILVSYIIWIIYILIILKLVGVGFTSLAVIAGSLGIGIGLGLRDIINNFASGLIILIGRSLKHGDIIQMNEQWGKVIKITIRSTLIQTFDNAVVSIPNSQIVSNQVVNWTHNNVLIRRDISVNVAYDSDIDKVKDIFLAIVTGLEHVLNKPKPIVLFDDFGDNALRFILRVWIDDIGQNVATLSIIRTEINKLFRENNIIFAFPQLDVHMDKQFKS